MRNRLCERETSQRSRHTLEALEPGFPPLQHRMLICREVGTKHGLRFGMAGWRKENFLNDEATLLRSRLVVRSNLGTDAQLLNLGQIVAIVDIGEKKAG